MRLVDSAQKYTSIGGNEVGNLLARRSVVQLGSAGLLGLGLGGRLSTQALAAATKPYKIALSNSYIGNKWRLEMENVFKAALQMEPFKSDVKGTWFNSGNSVSTQSQQLSNLIAQEVDAII